MKEYKNLTDYRFNSADYSVFTIMVVSSTLVGIYFAFVEEPEEPAGGEKGKDEGAKNMDDYLLGGRNMKVLPVAMSLVGSYVSGLTILGVSPEIYNYGTQYFLIFIPILVSSYFVAVVYLPVFHTLQVGSSYEYLEMRFSTKVRSFISFLFLIDEFFFLPMIVFVPALALNQVTGVNLYLIDAIITFLCVLYTLLGGMKAVVHTDEWQIFLMFVSVVVIAIASTTQIGFEEIINSAREGGRLIFLEMNPSFYERYTIWGISIGLTLYWTGFNSVNQTMVQRYMSLPTLRKGQLAIAIFAIGMCLFTGMCNFFGLLIYAYYKECDPLVAGFVQTTDQLLPIFVVQAVGYLRGLPGLFLAGVFGAALSSLSVVLNSTAMVLLEDIIKGSFKAELSQRTTTLVVKGSIVILGFLTFFPVFVLEKLKAIFSVATVLTGISASISLGIFSLGMLFPWSTEKGVLIGGCGGFIISGIYAFGKYAMEITGRLVYHKLPVAVDQCPGNVTVPDVDYSGEESVNPLFRVSFVWACPIGVLSTILFGIIGTFLTGATDLKTLNADLISPVVHRLLPQESFANSKTKKKGSSNS